MSINHLHFSCQGQSHKSTEKPCQDCSSSEYFSSLGLTTAVVCDGHGGERYFRSDIGAKLLCDITNSSLCSFVELLSQENSKNGSLEAKAFIGKAFTAISSSIEDDPFRRVTVTDRYLRSLFASIIAKWNEAISEHAANTPISDWEKEHVDIKYRNELINLINNNEVPAKTYGCTLMAYAKTKDYWFAFHIGDGKCIEFFDDDRLWMEPIPWDERCFLNKTTSICDSDAINEFRYCYEGDGNFPIAIFLGSDGMDDSFGEEENLVDFYVKIARMIAQDGREKTLHALEEDLPLLSKRGSQDDMSIACVYDEDMLSQRIGLFGEWQILRVKRQIAEINGRIEKLRKKKSSFIHHFFQSEKERIEFKYIESDLRTAYHDKCKLKTKIDVLNKEINGASFQTYEDEIGISDDIPQPIDPFEFFLLASDEEP